MIKSKIKLGKQKLKEDANINRSPTSYLRNPEEERNKYVQVLIDFKVLTSFFSKSTYINNSYFKFDLSVYKLAKKNVVF